MRPFSYARPGSVEEAVREIAWHPDAKFVAGGTNLVDLMKYDIERPTRLVDVSRLPGLKEIEETAEGGLRIGALVTNNEAAWHPAVRRGWGLLADAFLAGATPQLRNAATVGGNLLQRTRCLYFYDPQTGCNKREPGSGCNAISGINRVNAVLGHSERCIATNPSDMNVAMAALEAAVHVTGPNGERRIPIAEFHRLPGDEPERDTNLARDEIVLAVELPANRYGDHRTYLKLRDRLSYAFALVSVAAALDVEGGTIRRARIALGGVAHKPWRVEEAEAMLEGAAPGPVAFARAADRLLEGARGFRHNAFKIELARRAIPRALAQAAAGTPQSHTDKRIA